jgi:hypothetical protein
VLLGRFVSETVVQTPGCFRCPGCGSTDVEPTVRTLCSK